MQHRELQGFESDKFLSYFKPCIIPLEGGVASGFKHAEEEEFETKLYICHGKRSIKIKQVFLGLITFWKIPSYVLCRPYIVADRNLKTVLWVCRSHSHDLL